MQPIGMRLKMFKVLSVFAALGGALSGAATAGDLEESPVVPSGNQLTLQEVIFETRQDNSRVARYRYVMPAIAQGIAFKDVESDFAVLCDGFIVKALREKSKTVDQVIVSLSDRETEFGVTSAQAIQYFEAFRLENDTCIWEAF